MLVAVGGGGLMAGVAAALEGRARVVARRARAAARPSTPPWRRASRSTSTVSGVAADSLGATRLGAIAWDVARRTGVRSVLVGDDDVVRARRLLWERHRLVVEHGAATVVAALVEGAYVPADGERVAVVLCGANTSPATSPPRRRQQGEVRQQVPSSRLQRGHARLPVTVSVVALLHGHDHPRVRAIEGRVRPGPTRRRCRRPWTRSAALSVAIEVAQVVGERLPAAPPSTRDAPCVQAAASGTTWSICTWSACAFVKATVVPV